MTGTQSLSIAQLRAITAEADRLDADARATGRWAETSEGERVYFAQPVTVRVHQAEPFTKGDKRVDFDLAFSHSVSVWYTRDGAEVRRYGG